MLKYNIAVRCYDEILLNVTEYVMPGYVYVVRWSGVYTNHKLHMQPHLPRFYHNGPLLYCILTFNNS